MKCATFTLQASNVNVRAHGARGTYGVIGKNRPQLGQLAPNLPADTRPAIGQ